MYKDKVAIITGGGAGIGLAAAQLLATKGTKVLITGRRTNVLEQIAASYPNIEGFTADAADPEAAARTVTEAIERWGRLDIVVNNVGNGSVQPLATTNAQEINDIFSVNVTAPTLLAAAALPHLEKTKGTIINISSTFGSKASAGLSIYSASKAALEQLTRCWALELAPKGIRVNAIASGPVESDFLRERMGLSEEQINAVKKQEIRSIPLGRRGVPDDVARWIVHLADPESNWITGQVFPVDGGLTIA
ncbi:NAD(P)-dependent dehydrogenase (short-subunit alcohol dehydrogenase family) [Paenibacillus rhizosphaerae]|uniref:NAD(P)-dependent dehydrogenase (Short-subunit alcohol dehydrogenase family) n=1 Tax=Paenibacillus rhizosphaerae TaxID=297318 RepID=A0A839TP95_9BACL|nr:SDR family oxidoreductase [Paenibacillus rhizosphaerae]MBB3128636.1 NAD(P)-dependent dehydrogenase (short-subunit alcohol dehydrogenase family) [Paenibacillus rhizosphaerae]